MGTKDDVSCPRARLGVVGGLLRSLGGLGWFVMGDGVPGAIRSAMGNKPRRGVERILCIWIVLRNVPPAGERNWLPQPRREDPGGPKTRGHFFPRHFQFFPEPNRGREDPPPLWGIPRGGGVHSDPFGSGDPPPGESPTFKGSQGGRHLRGRGKRGCERPGTFRWLNSLAIIGFGFGRKASEE